MPCPVPIRGAKPPRFDLRIDNPPTLEEVITVILVILGATPHQARWLIPARHAVDRLLFSLLRRRWTDPRIALVSSLHIADGRSCRLSNHLISLRASSP